MYPTHTNADDVCQLLNEEGLPIIEIAEQIGPEQPSSSNAFAPPFSADLPSWTLPEDEKARRRAERERILDTLEEEEHLQAEQEAAKEEESRAAKKKRLEAARELQRAMGRALVKNVNDFKAREEKERGALLQIDTMASAEKSIRLKPKKSVTFDLPPEVSPISVGPQQDWGDVTPARLQPKQPSAPAAHGPMKIRVVERFPRKLQLGSSPKDSDDESDPEPAPDSDEEDRPTPTHAKHVEFHSDESTEDGGDFEFDESEIDLDAAQHQREIALAYYEKREKFATQAAAVFSSHSHIEEDPWDQPVGFFIPSLPTATEALTHTCRMYHSKQASLAIGRNQPSPNSRRIESFLHPLPSMVSSYPLLSLCSCEIPSS